MRVGLGVLALVVAILVAGTSPKADSALPAPTGSVILEVSGAITRTNGAGANGDAVARFDLAMLQAVGQGRIATANPWSEGVRTYDGVPAAALMAYLGAEGSAVEAVALNDYTVTIPIADFTAYGVLFATHKDGKPMPVRDKGPIFVVYPFDAQPKLTDTMYYERSIWQLTRLKVKP